MDRLPKVQAVAPTADIGDALRVNSPNIQINLHVTLRTTGPLRTTKRDLARERRTASLQGVNEQIRAESQDDTEHRIHYTTSLFIPKSGARLNPDLSPGFSGMFETESRIRLPFISRLEAAGSMLVRPLEGQ
jgi:hypothetical protein